MATRPRTPTDILTEVRKQPQGKIRARSSKTNLSKAFESHLTTFSLEPNVCTVNNNFANSLPWPEPMDSYSGNSTCFSELVTPEIFKATLEMEEKGVVDVFGVEDVEHDDRMEGFLGVGPPLDTSGRLSESTTNSISAPRVRTSHSDRIKEILGLLRDHRISPFDLVIELLDKNKPEYSVYQREFYKDGNEKLSKFLDVLISGDSGRRKFQTWIQQPAALNMFCDIITDEMNLVQKTKRLSGIAAITPGFIQNWSASTNQELAPCTLRILSTAAQTSTAKEKN